MTKVFGGQTAVDRLSLTVPRGSFFGLLGPNGAGKTTTIRILTTLTRPTSGRALIDGHDVVSQPVPAKRMIGLVPQQYNLDNELSGRENLDLHGRLFGLDRKLRRERTVEVLDLVNLTEAADRQARKFSGGMKRRLMIGRALLHRPEVLFLDEPTIGLDVEGRRKLWGLLTKINRQGKTILLTTHYIEEAEELCDTVGIIDHGRLIAQDSPADLISSAGQYVVDAIDDDNLTSHFFESRSEAGSFAAGLDCQAHIRPANLEDVFVKLTGRKVSDPPSPAGLAQGGAS